ncbi:MAG TPA: hypothetical protein VN578_10845, partial [Candidatus Binatia bacterium]|nr:hypothetical protein [Candidatus Binatia bacterium]
AKTTAAQLKKLDPKRVFTEQENLDLLDRTDDLLGYKSAERIRAEMQQTDPRSPPARARTTGRRLS